MANKRPEFDYKVCMACAICAQSCPFSCINMSLLGVDRYRKAYPELTHANTCTGCGVCARDCPFDCIAMRDSEAISAPRNMPSATRAEAVAKAAATGSEP
jgi:Pyruvate/2-oxoacid:ferredoxin oxidoreductase delta subunit